MSEMHQCSILIIIAVITKPRQLFSRDGTKKRSGRESGRLQRAGGRGRGRIARGSIAQRQREREREK